MSTQSQATREGSAQTQGRTIAEVGGAAGQGAGALSAGQLVAVGAIGVAIWFAAAMVVQFGGPAGLFGPSASLIMFALGIPLCWLLVLLSRRLARLKAGQALPGIAIGLVAATFCDAIALTWGRGLYGSDPAQVLYGAAWILWGVALFLLFAYLADRRQAGAAH